LIKTEGTHFITSTESECTNGAKVTAREKQALNRLSVSISGELPEGIKSVGLVRNTGPLDLRCRALPKHLALAPRYSQASGQASDGDS